MTRAGLTRCAIFGWALAFAPGVARATSAGLFGAGPRSAALAGAGVSLELGPESTLQNAAELAQAEHNELQAGLFASRFDLELGGSAAGAASPGDATQGFYFGVVAPLFTGDARAAFGFYADSPPAFIVRARQPLTEEPHFPLLVGRSQALDFGAALAGGVGPFSIGVGLRALAALGGAVGVEERDGVETEVVDNQLRPAYAAAFGLALEPGLDFSFGLALRTTLRADFDVELATADLAGVALPPLNISGVAHYEPLRVDAEVSRRFGRALALVALGYERWSELPAPLGQTVRCPPERARCGTEAPPSPNASDIIVPRIAGSYDFDLPGLEVTLRAGYSHVPSALPEQHDEANAFDSPRHALTAGYSVRLLPPLAPFSLDGAVRGDVLMPRTHHKSAGGSVRTSGSVLTVFFGAGVEL